MTMNDFILGSHNSWSYGCESKKWMRYFRPIARCQNCNILEQYESGVRCFDLRLRYDELEKGFVACHGLVTYRNNFMLDLIELHHKAYNGEDIYVRVLLEDGGKVNYNVDYMFRMKCKYLEKRFSFIKFIGGYPARKRWRLHLYKFKTDEPNIDEKHVSVSGKIWELVPRRWANRHNDEVIKGGTKSEVLMIDFV